jgi:hypothetical protein
MTGALDAEMRQLAVDLAQELGRSLTFVEVTSTFDATTGETTETTTETQLAAVPPQNFRFDQIDNSLIEAGDAVIGLPAQAMPVAPTTDDRVKMNGATWKIVQVAPVASGDKDALYEVQVTQ